MDSFKGRQMGLFSMDLGDLTLTCAVTKTPKAILWCHPGPLVIHRRARMG